MVLLEIQSEIWTVSPLSPMILLVHGSPVFCSSSRHVAEAASRLSLPGIRVVVCGFLGHHATGGLGELRSRTVRDVLHTGLVAGPGLGVRPDLRHVHPLLLPGPSHRHHRLLLRHDHLQGQVFCKGDLQL